MLQQIKKIIFINEYPTLYGGTEHYVLHVSRELRECNIRTVLLYNGKHLPDQRMIKEFDESYPIIDIKAQLKKMPDGVIYLNNYRDINLVKSLTEVNNPVFRYIHDHYLTCPRSSKTSPLNNETCTKKVGINCYTCPGVVSKHNGELIVRTPKVTLKELKLHNNFTNIIVSSLYLQREMVKNGALAKRITINPIYQSEFPETREGSLAKTIKRDPKKILFIGSLIKGKGVDLLIKALSRVDYPFHLTIAGDGAWRKKLEDLAETTEMKSSIKFVGNITTNKIAELYKKSIAVIVPSTLPETFSKAGADGIHFGALPICADVGGISSWLINGKNGVLFKSGSVSSLANTLTKLGAGDYESVIKKINYIPSALPTLKDHTNRLIEIIDFELNRRGFPPKKYSYSETPEFIKEMDNVCNKFKEVVLKHISKSKIDSIILIGGYGRGEGGVINVDGVAKPHNNLDFQIILNTPKVGSFSDKRDPILKDLKKYMTDKMITLDFSFNTKLKIKYGVPQLVYYDMKYGHRLVYGSDSWLLNIKRFNSKNIHVYDIRELLINRGSLLIINKKILQEKELTKEMKMVIVKHFVKAIIGYGDAFLYMNGKYHWSYKRKKELMWTLKPANPAFARIYDYAINFRFNPNYDRVINTDLKALQRFIIRNIEKVHLDLERKISKNENLSWNSYFSYVSCKPLYSKKANILNFAKLLFNNVLLGKNDICPELRNDPSIKCKVLGNRGLLMAIFPHVLYSANLDFPGLKKVGPVLDFYIKSWGQTNDENFDQSLPGKMINKEVA